MNFSTPPPKNVKLYLPAHREKSSILSLGRVIVELARLAMNLTIPPTLVSQSPVQIPTVMYALPQVPVSLVKSTTLFLEPHAFQNPNQLLFPVRFKTAKPAPP